MEVDPNLEESNRNLIIEEEDRKYMSEGNYYFNITHLHKISESSQMVGFCLNFFFRGLIFLELGKSSRKTKSMT
jgi:hypothetical protein